VIVYYKRGRKLTLTQLYCIVLYVQHVIYDKSTNKKKHSDKPVIGACHQNCIKYSRSNEQVEVQVLWVRVQVQLLQLVLVTEVVVLVRAPKVLALHKLTTRHEKINSQRIDDNTELQ